ncbi:MAG: hypothetical protein V4787_02630 [Pseudomonadota bacterium]
MTIVWNTFEKAALAGARARRMPDIQLAVIPSRKGDDTDEDQRVKARDAVPGLVKQLLSV